MAEVEKRRTPTMGICLGSQLMNVYRGGSLNQFLPEMDRPARSSTAGPAATRSATGRKPQPIN